VTCLRADDDTAREALGRERPRVLVVEAPDDGSVWRVLGHLSPPVVVRVSLDGDSMDVYRGHQTLPAGSEALIEAVTAGLRYRRAW